MKIKKLLSTLFLLTLMLNVSAETSLIPAPAEMKQNEGYFALKGTTTISYPTEIEQTAQYFISEIKPATGFTLKKVAANGEINFLLNSEQNNSKLGDEGYELTVTSSKVNLTANTEHGIFNGIQTLIQLLPAEIESDKNQDVQWTIPAVTIKDYPRFGWRGLMLDVSRHFYTIDEVKAYIDQMARYKFNIFHWHLTDDQGWRIEIKGLPKLTEIGAWRVHREGNWWSFDRPKSGEEKTYGGFYTQEEIKDVIKYAAARHITIIPEIDVPGHSLEVLAAYPELACRKKKYNVNPGSKFWGEIPNTLCAGREVTFEYLEIILKEVAELFPAEYIHIGGDEANRKPWFWCSKCRKRMRKEHLHSTKELQSYFIKRVEKIAESFNKKIIGWDEILEGGLAPNAAVMSWRGIDGGVAAAKMKHNVVMSPSPYYYLDLFQGDPLFEPNTYSMARLKTTYEFNPMPEGVEQQYILGVQGNLWTEEVSEFRHAQYMTWPRSFAIAESGWSNESQKEWKPFTKKVEEHFKRFDFAQIKYAKSVYDPIAMIVKTKDGLKIKIETEFPDLEIYYTFEGADPDNFYPLYTEPVAIPLNPAEIKIVAYKNGKQMGRIVKYPISVLKERM